MTGIQILLVAAGLFWIGRYLAKLRSKNTSRLLAVAAALVAIVFVLFPEITVVLAKALGVTRGVDLLMYVSFVVFGFLWLHLAHRIRELEERVVEMGRAMALAGGDRETKVEPPGNEEPSA